jgi:hypothetical protein
MAQRMGAKGRDNIVILLLLFWTMMIGKVKLSVEPPYGSPFASPVSVGPDSMAGDGDAVNHFNHLGQLGSRQRRRAI